MKTATLLSILTVVLFVFTYSQKPTLELSFTAENNGGYIPIDSIIIENLTQGGDTILYGPDTLLLLEYGLGIKDFEFSNHTFSISQNYPNPFIDKTTFNLYLPNTNHIRFTVSDLLGRELASYDNTLILGNHSFTLYPGNERYYLLTIFCEQSFKTIKMLSTKSNLAYGEKCEIVYNGLDNSESRLKFRQTTNDFEFSLGDELQFTAYALTKIQNIGSAIIADIPEINTTYKFDILGGLRCAGISAVTDIDGNKYNTVQIGSQCWMKENLKTTTYTSGTSIPNVTGNNAWANLTTGAYEWYDNDISWKDKYGALYNWYATIDTHWSLPRRMACA